MASRTVLWDAKESYLEHMNIGRVPVRVPFLHPLWHSCLQLVNHFSLATEKVEPLIFFHLHSNAILGQGRAR